MTAYRTVVPRSRMWLLELVTAGVCAGVVWVLFVRPVQPADLDVFLRAGHTVRDGLSPYVDSSSSQVWSGHAFVYPYLTAWWFVPLSWLHARAAALLYYLASVIALIVTVRLAGGRRGVAVVLLAFTAEPIVRALQLGTLNVWLLLGLAGAWRYRDRMAPVVLALTALIVAKLFLLPMLLWLVVTGRRRSALRVVAASVAAIVVGCALADLSVMSFVHMLSALSAHEAPHSSSVTSRLLRLGAGPTVAAIVAGTLALAIAVVTAWRSHRTGDERYVFCGCVVASLVLSPIVWSHYLVLLLLIPLVWGWNTRVMVGALLTSWLLSAPSGLPAMNYWRTEPGVRPALTILAVLTIAVVAAPTLRQVLRRLRPGYSPTGGG